MCTCKEDMNARYRVAGVTQAPVKCPDKPDRVHTQCKKCGEILALDFGKLNRTEALAALHAGPGECPGYHVEFDLGFYWQADAAVSVMYGA